MSYEFPLAIAQIGSIPAQRGYLIAPPICWSVLAEQMHMESGTAVSGARFAKQHGEFHAVEQPKSQDAYVQGVANRTGRAFTQVKGAWSSDLWHEDRHCHGLLYANGAPSTGAADYAEVVSADTTSDIEDCRILLRRGKAPVSTNANVNTRQQATNYIYLHLAYQSPDNLDYRLALEWAQPPRLDITYDGGKTWVTGVGTCSDLAALEKYSANNPELALSVKTANNYRTLSVEIGDGNYIVHQPDKNLCQPAKTITSFASSAHLLPTQGKIRLISRNAWVAMWYLPNRYSDINITKSTRDFGYSHPNAQNAIVTTNGLTDPHPSQIDTPTITTDGQKFSFNIKTSMPDAGDGQGSKNPARLANADLLIPGVWDTTIPGTPPGYLDSTQYLKAQHVVESEVVDDVTRTVTTRGVLVCDNHYGDYTGSYGNVALNLSASVSADGQGAFAQRMFGMAGAGVEGIKFTRRDPTRLMELPFGDFSLMMQVALCDEIIADGWCLFGLVWHLCEKANTHPHWLKYIPYYPPGKAGYDCPYFILPSGSGNHPKFRYTPEMSIWAILLQLVLDASDIDPRTGLPVPYYMGFDPDGYFHFEPVALYANPVTINYSDTDPTGVGSIYGIEVFNSVADMRTELNFQGLDAETYELLYYHLPLPPYVAVAKGFRDTWMERNARFASLEYLMYVANVAAIQASLPQQTVVLKAPFRPWVHAGDLCTITERYALGYSGTFTIKSLRNVWGINMDGSQDSYSIVTCRAVQNTY